MGSSGSEAPLISILLPTRGRVELARTFLDSLSRTAREPSRVEVIVYVDEDDPASAAIAEPRLHLITVVGPPATMGAINAACLGRASGEIIMLGNDDVIVQTEGWDAHVRSSHARFPDGIYLAWPNDRFASNRMSTFPIVSRRTCDVLVEPFPLAYRSAFIDYDLFDVFTRLKRLGHDRMMYMRALVFEHRHHRTGKRVADATTRRHRRFADDTAFLGRRDVRQRQAERLAAAVERLEFPSVVTAAPLVPPSSLLGALWRFAIAFLGDQGLPLHRRGYLFVWYCGRYVAARLQRRAALS